MTSTTPAPAPDDAIDPGTVPAHYNERGRWCAGAGQSPNAFGKCPFGCDHADHYANDGHAECHDPAPWEAEAALLEAGEIDRDGEFL